MISTAEPRGNEVWNLTSSARRWIKKSSLPMPSGTRLLSSESGISFCP
jgi:hypothetical protein